MAGQGGQPQAGQKTPEEVAAEEQAAAEAKAAAEQKTADENAAAAKPAAAKSAEKPAKSEAKPKGYKVIGAAAVLRGEDKSERYLYRGATFDGNAFSKDSVEHNVSAGLIEKVK